MQTILWADLKLVIEIVNTTFNKIHIKLYKIIAILINSLNFGVALKKLGLHIITYIARNKLK